MRDGARAHVTGVGRGPGTSYTSGPGASSAVSRDAGCQSSEQTCLAATASSVNIQPVQASAYGVIQLSCREEEELWK